MRSIPHYLSQSSTTILRAYTLYRPLRVFMIMGILLIVGGLIPVIRFLYFYTIGSSSGHVQSLILAAILMIIGFQTLVIGLLADLIGFNRMILEELLYRLRRLEFRDQGSHTPSSEQSPTAPDREK
jgi:hypothetical protein